jgi:hypothetical protein
MSIAQGSKLFTKNSIATYSFAFAGGFADGMADNVIADKFPNSHFWKADSWRNKYKYGAFRREVLTFTCDGYHASKMTSYVMYSAAIGVTIGQKMNWKLVVAKILISFAVSRLGHEVAYKIVVRDIHPEVE